MNLKGLHIWLRYNYKIYFNQELIMWRGEYLTLYSPVIDDCAEVKRLPFHVT